MTNLKNYIQNKVFNGEGKSLTEHLTGKKTDDFGIIDENYDGTELYPVNEGLRDIFNSLKKKVSQVVSYLKTVVVKAKNYWLAVWEGSSDSENPEYLSAITPFTTAQAYVGNGLNRYKTFVFPSPTVAKTTGCKTKVKDATKLYGSGNSLQYYNSMPIKESLEQNQALQQFFEGLGLTKIPYSNIINEVKMHTDDPSAKYNIFDNDELLAEIDYKLKNPTGAPLLIFGAPGIGKTALLNQVLKGYNKVIESKKDQWQLIVKTLSNETPENFMLPKYVDVDGATRAEDIPKTWLPVYKPTGDPAKDAAASEACGRGLLFIDELSRATPQVLNVMLPLINERKINEWRLGENWVIICASNRMEDEAYGQTEIGNAMANRFQICYYEPTVKTWAKWAAKQNYMSPLLLDWLQMGETETHAGGKYFYYDPNEKNPDDSPSKVMCTPRSWDNAMQRLAPFGRTAEEEGWDILSIKPAVIGRVLNQFIPPQAIDSFLAFLGVIRGVGSMDEFAAAVWGGKKPKVKDNKVFDMIPFQICQILITSRKDSLPNEKEMVNLFKWLVSIDNPALAGYMIDMIKSVYASALGNNEQLKNHIFTLQSTAKELLASGTKDDIKYYEKLSGVMSQFLESWGLKKLEDMPDWRPAMNVFFDHPAYADLFTITDAQGNLLFDKGGRAEDLN